MPSPNKNLESRAKNHEGERLFIREGDDLLYLRREMREKEEFKDKRYVSSYIQKKVPFPPYD